MSVKIPNITDMTDEEIERVAAPLCDPMTSTAVQRGLSTLISYTPIIGNDDGEEALTAVLTDLLHWCRENKVLFSACLGKARNTYEEELARRAAAGDVTVY